jgi:hypothetical protein
VQTALLEGLWECSWAKSRDVPMRTHSAREVCVLKRHLPGEREGELGADFIYFVENTP